MIQPTLPFQKHSATSRAAAESVVNADSLEGLVLAFIQERGDEGATDLEAQAALKLDGSTQRPRRRKLEQLGLVFDSGRTRATLSGRQAVVWIAKGEDR